MAKYGKYNEFGVSKTGEVDPRRKVVSTFIGLLGGNRDSADWLYTKIKDMRGGGKDDGKDDGKKNQNAGRSPIRDVDFGMDGKPTYSRPGRKPDRPIRPIELGKLPKVPDKIPDIVGVIPSVPVVNPLVPEDMPDSPKMNYRSMRDGGVVRGAGKALRGRGRGKMV